MSTDSSDDWTVSSNGLMFDSFGKVHIAYEMVNNYRYRWNLCPGCLGNIYYQSRLIIGKYDYTANSMDFIREQKKYYGRSIATVCLTNTAGTASNMYVAGSSETRHWTTIGTGNRWGPSITIINETGDFSAGWQIQLDGDWQTDEDDHTVIGTMAVDLNYFFGTMRSVRIKDNPGEHTLFWRIGMTVDNLLDTANVNIQKIDDNGGFFNEGFFVTGIRKTLGGGGDEIDMVLAQNDNSEKELWYIKATFTQTSQTAVKIYDS